MTKEEKD
jgi:26S proteasome regulatory subunit T1